MTGENLSLTLAIAKLIYWVFKSCMPKGRVWEREFINVQHRKTRAKFLDIAPQLEGLRECAHAKINEICNKKGKNEVPRDKIRANIFVPRTEGFSERAVELYIPDEFQRNMPHDRRRERRISFQQGQGATGNCFQGGYESRVALREELFGVDEFYEQKVSPNLQWVISFSLCPEQSVLAVLNVDGLQKIEKDTLEECAKYLLKDCRENGVKEIEKQLQGLPHVAVKIAVI